MKPENLQKVNDIRDQIVGSLSELEDLMYEGTEGTPDETMDNCIVFHKVCRDIQDAVKGVQEKSRESLSEAMAWKGVTDFHGDNGRAYVTHASTYSKYDTKALDALVDSSEELSRVLSPHRKIMERAGHCIFVRRESMSDMAEGILSENRSSENVRLDQQIEMDTENMVIYARCLARIIGEFNDELLDQGIAEEVRTGLVHTFFQNIIADVDDTPVNQPSSGSSAE